MSQFIVQVREGNVTRSVPIDAENSGQALRICRHHHPRGKVISAAASGVRAPIKAAKPTLPPRASKKAFRVHPDRIPAEPMSP